MIALEKARSFLETLRLDKAAMVLDSRLDGAAQRQLSYPESLAALLGIEVEAREDRYLKAHTKLTHFPLLRTLEQFDFSFQPSIDQRLVKELATMAFVADATTVIFLGPPGVGKMQLCMALGLKALEQGHGVYFVTAHDLTEGLRRAQEEHRLDRRMRVYTAPKLLIIDGFGV